MGFARHYLSRFKIAGKIGQAKLEGVMTSSRLAPGRIVQDDTFYDDQFHLYKLYNEYGRIFTAWIGGKLTTCIVGHDLGLRFLTENKAKLRTVTIDLTPLFPEGFLRMMEGETHNEYRRIFINAFRAILLQLKRAELRGILSNHLTQLTIGENRLRSDEVAKVFKRASTAVMLRLVLGAKDGSAIARELTEAYNDYAPNGINLVVQPTDLPKYERIKRLVLKLATDMKSSDGTPESLLEFMVRSEKFDETVIGNLIHMTEFGRYDLHSLWRWILLELARDRSYLHLIASEADADRRELMARSAVSETLRMQQSEFIQRTAVKSIVFEGFLIPRRSRVRVCIWEGHRDPGQFPEPHVFKPDRFVDQKFSSASYSPLGLDRHRCLGADWTLQLSSMLVEEIAENFSVELISYGHPNRGRFHYQPGPDSQISLSRRPQSENQTLRR